VSIGPKYGKAVGEHVEVRLPGSGKKMALAACVGCGWWQKALLKGARKFN